MAAVSYDYSLSDGSFRLYNKQEYVFDSGCLITDYGNHIFLSFSWEIQRICAHDHVDTREYLSFKRMFDLS